MKECSNCGHSNYDAADVCVKCGNKLARIEVETPYSEFKKLSKEREEKTRELSWKISKWEIIVDIIIGAIIVIIILANK